MDPDEFAERLWTELHGAHKRWGIYADVQRAISVLGPDASQRLGDFHVLRARADGVIR